MNLYIKKRNKSTKRFCFPILYMFHIRYIIKVTIMYVIYTAQITFWQRISTNMQTYSCNYHWLKKDRNYSSKIILIKILSLIEHIRSFKVMKDNNVCFLANVSDIILKFLRKINNIYFSLYIIFKLNYFLTVQRSLHHIN